MEELISVVIPTFNRGKILMGVLPSYLRQKYIKEVIIVDDLSSDNTGALVKDLQLENNKIKYIKNHKRSGTNQTSNNGLRIASGDFIFIGEDDVELSDDHLEILLAHLQKEDADIISGRRIWVRLGESNEQALERADKTPGPEIDYRTILTNFEGVSEDDVEVPVLDACMLIKRRVTDLVEFDAGLYKDAVGWRGETDFQLSAAAQGLKLVFCPHTYCLHRPRRPRNLIRTIVYDYYAFKNNFLFLKKHKNFIAENFEFKNIILIYFFGLFTILKGNLLVLGGKVKKVLKRFFLSRTLTGQGK